MTAGFEIQALHAPATLGALAPEWWALWRRAASATPFQSPAWLVPWIRQFAPETLRALALRRDGRLVGLLPLFALGDRLLPCGAGISDYLDGVFEDGLGAAAAAAVLAHLRRSPEPWDTLDLFNLRPGSALLDAAAPAGWADERGERPPCPVLALPATLPRRMAQNLRYYGRRAAKAGAVRFERAEPATAPALLEELFRLHAARWAERGEPGVLADAAVRRFQREAVPALADAGLLRLYALRLDDRPVAVLYGLQAKGRAYHYLGGFDPALAPLGPGTLIVGHAIAEAAREGAREFDFLGGGEPYKYRWGAADRPVFGRALRRRTEPAGRAWASG